MAFKAFFPNKQAAELLGCSRQKFSELVKENHDLLTPALPSCKGRTAAWSVIQLEIYIDVIQFERTDGKYGLPRDIGRQMLELSLKRLGRLSIAQLDTGAQLFKEIMSEIKSELNLAVPA